MQVEEVSLWEKSHESNLLYIIYAAEIDVGQLSIMVLQACPCFYGCPFPGKCLSPSLFVCFHVQLIDFSMRRTTIEVMHYFLHGPQVLY